ncbi:hypothetical protein ACIGNX_05295 [Actinosynnema sp. NPDC053489]|uniref:hypothetical protein n=1 Tax=Actinosynnema sp. NPDC053489 TaxID=3363916 RepID=UPI0037CA3743
MEILIASLLSLISILIAYKTLRSQNSGGKLKRLHYTSNSFRFILPENIQLEDAEQFMKVKLDDYEFIHPMVVAVRFENTGLAPITPDDFTAPIKIHFGEHAAFTNGTIQWNRPDIFDHEKTKVTTKNGALVIEPLLLNPRDQVTLLAVVDGFADDIKVTTRVAGVEEVVNIPPPNENITTDLTVTSLLYERRADWPPAKTVEALAYTAPLVMNVNSSFDSTPQVYVANKRLIKPGHFLLAFKNISAKTIYTSAYTEELTFNLGGARAVHLSAHLDDKRLSESQISKMVLADSNTLTIRRARIKPGETLTLEAFTSGDLKISVLEKPDWIDDISHFEHSIDGFLENNLAKTSPRALLLDSRIHGVWHRNFPRISRRLKSAKNRASHTIQRVIPATFRRKRSNSDENTTD